MSKLHLVTHLKFGQSCTDSCQFLNFNPVDILNRANSTQSSLPQVIVLLTCRVLFISSAITIAVLGKKNTFLLHRIQNITYLKCQTTFRRFYRLNKLPWRKEYCPTAPPKGYHLVGRPNNSKGTTTSYLSCLLLRSGLFELSRMIRL